MIRSATNRTTIGIMGAVVILTGVAMPTPALAQPYTLECAAITWGGGTVEQDQIGVIGQAVVGTASNALFTIDAGIVPCLATEPPGGGIPTVSQWGLGIMGLLTLTAGTLVFRHRPSLRTAALSGEERSCP